MINYHFMLVRLLEFSQSKSRHVITYKSEITRTRFTMFHEFE